MDTELEIHERHIKADELLTQTIIIISKMLNREPLHGPPYEIAAWILREYFPDEREDT